MIDTLIHHHIVFEEIFESDSELIDFLTEFVLKAPAFKTLQQKLLLCKRLINTKKTLKALSNIWLIKLQILIKFYESLMTHVLDQHFLHDK